MRYVSKIIIESLSAGQRLVLLCRCCTTTGHVDRAGRTRFAGQDPFLAMHSVAFTAWLIPVVASNSKGKELSELAEQGATALHYAAYTCDLAWTLKVIEGARDADGDTAVASHGQTTAVVSVSNT